MRRDRVVGEGGSHETTFQKPIRGSCVTVAGNERKVQVHVVLILFLGERLCHDVAAGRVREWMIGGRVERREVNIAEIAS
jgi:hypothetical protein